MYHTAPSWGLTRSDYIAAICFSTDIFQGSRKKQSVCIHTLQPQIHPSVFHSAHDIYTLKPVVKE